MTKKILIIFIITVLLVVSTAPALAQKPPQSNGQGNTDHSNNGNGNTTHSNSGNGNTTQADNGHANAVNPGILNASQSSKQEDNSGKTSLDRTKGFNEWGYNYTARIFNGTGMSWCMAKYDDTTKCEELMGAYANDKLIMKWNAEWDRGNDDGWTNPPYNAWENNQWNGKVEGGSGEVWHYKIVWIGDCGPDGTVLENGGYCLWGQFEVLMDHGTADGVHNWVAHANPGGYGSYP